MQGLHVVFAVDRAGLVGEDGETHHGINDIGFLRQAPGMCILCPASTKEQADMLRWSVMEQKGPVAIRYPRGGNRTYSDSAWCNSCDVRENGMLTCHRVGSDVTLITYGTLLENVMDAADILSRQGIEATVLRLLSVQPLPIKEILSNLSAAGPVIVLEEVSGNCGIRDTIAFELGKLCPDRVVDGIDLGCRFIQHVSGQDLYDHYGLSGRSIAEFAMEVHQREN